MCRRFNSAPSHHLKSHIGKSMVYSLFGLSNPPKRITGHSSFWFTWLLSPVLGSPGPAILSPGGQIGSLQPERVFSPGPSQQRHLVWQRFLLQRTPAHSPVRFLRHAAKTRWPVRLGPAASVGKATPCDSCKKCLTLGWIGVLKMTALVFTPGPAVTLTAFLTNRRS